MQKERPLSFGEAEVGQGGGGGLRSGSVKSNCEKLRKTAVPQPNLPKPQGATPLHRGPTRHQQAREVDKQKATAENCEKLRTSTPPPPLVAGGGIPRKSPSTSELLGFPCSCGVAKDTLVPETAQPCYWCPIWDLNSV